MFVSLIFHDPLVQKMTTASPLGRSVYLNFRHNVSKEYKKEVRNFGEPRSKGSRVPTASLTVRAKKPPQSIGSKRGVIPPRETINGRSITFNDKLATHDWL